MSNTIVGSIFLNESKARCARAATYGEIILATGDLGMPPGTRLPRPHDGRGRKMVGLRPHMSRNGLESGIPR